MTNNFINAITVLNEAVKTAEKSLDALVKNTLAKHLCELSYNANSNTYVIDWNTDFIIQFCYDNSPIKYEEADERAEKMESIATAIYEELYAILDSCNFEEFDLMVVVYPAYLTIEINTKYFNYNNKVQNLYY